MSNPVSEMIENTMKNMQTVINVDSVIGEPIRPDANTVIIPIAKVSYGFGGGGTDMVKKSNGDGASFAGGVGGGTSVKAEAFLVISNGNVRIVPVAADSSTVDKIVDLVPGMVDKISGFFNKNKSDSGETE